MTVESMFLALDLLFHRKTLSRRQILLLAIGVAVVFLGTYLAESARLAFDLSTLPYAIGIIVFSGIGYYALQNNTGRIKEGSKNIGFSVAAIASAMILILIYHNSAIFTSIRAVPFIEGVLSGFFLCIAFSMEIRAVKHSMTGMRARMSC